MVEHVYLLYNSDDLEYAFLSLEYAKWYAESVFGPGVWDADGDNTYLMQSDETRHGGIYHRAGIFIRRVELKGTLT